MWPGFTTGESARIFGFLHKLRPYLRLDECCLVGSLAIQWRLHEAGIEPGRDRPLNDLDMIARSPASIDARAARAFEVGHQHQRDSRFYLTLIDPATQLKLDIFTWAGDDDRAQMVKLAGQRWPVSSAEHQLVATLADAQKPTHGQELDPKQLTALEHLLAITDQPRAGAIWQEHYPAGPGFEAALQTAAMVARRYPHLVRPLEHTAPAAKPCTDCVALSGWQGAAS